jgi:hypothetical protein
MILEADYFFHGVPRWNLGWPNPNYAGAFLATLTPWCWWLQVRWTKSAIPIDQDPRGFRRLRLVPSLAFIAEVVLWFLLGKTYSRGGLVAAVTGLLGWLVFTRGLETLRGRLLRSSVGVAIAGLPGLFGRLSPSFLQQDGATLHRLDLWHGGLQMIAAAPGSGWGAGEAGRAYMNWFELPGHEEGYGTMVNGFLQVAVEHGLWALAGILFVLAMLWVIAWQIGNESVTHHDAASRRTARSVAAATAATLVVWAVANLFSTLWIDVGLWLVPALAVLALLVLTWINRPVQLTRNALMVSAGAAAAGTCGLWLAAVIAARGTPLQVVPGVQGSIVVRSGSGTTRAVGRICQVWTDSAVLGTMPGKEIRRWLTTNLGATTVVVHDAREGTIPSLADTAVVVLCGQQAARMDERIRQGARNIILLNPIGATPAQGVGARACDVTVMLGTFDQMGDHPAWLGWARQQRAEVRWLPGIGLNLGGLVDREQTPWLALLNPVGRSRPIEQFRPSQAEVTIADEAVVHATEGSSFPAAVVSPAERKRTAATSTTRTPPWHSEEWSRIERRLGDIRLDGTLRCSFPLADSAEAAAVCGPAVLEHSVALSPWGRPTTVWRIAALTTWLLPEADGRLCWQRPGGDVVHFDRRALGPALAPAGNGPWLVRERTPGQIDIRLPDGRSWEYREGALVAVEHPLRGRFQVTTRGALIVDLMRVEGGTSDRILHADYDVSGRLVTLHVGNTLATLEWRDGELTRLVGGEPKPVNFSYRGGLVAAIEPDGGPPRTIAWRENSDWWRGDSKWLAPVRLAASSGRTYTHTLSPRGYGIVVRDDTGRIATEIVYNPRRSRLEEKTSDGQRRVVMFHRGRVGIGSGIDQIMDGSGALLEAYRYTAEGLLIGVSKQGAPEESLDYDTNGRLLTIAEGRRS